MDNLIDKIQEKWKKISRFFLRVPMHFLSDNLNFVDDSLMQFQRQTYTLGWVNILKMVRLAYFTWALD